MSEDLSSWYTGEQAAARLGISARTFHRLVADGRSKEFRCAPEKRKRARNGGRKPESVYNPDEVDTLATLARTRVLPPERAELSHLKNGGMPEGLTLALRLVERMAEIAGGASSSSSSSSFSGKLYLTIPEAAQASGLSRALLKRLCRAGHLGFRDGRRWVIARDDLANSANVAELARFHAWQAAGSGV